MRLEASKTLIIAEFDRIRLREIKTVVRSLSWDVRVEFADTLNQAIAKALLLNADFVLFDWDDPNAIDLAQGLSAKTNATLISWSESPEFSAALAAGKRGVSEFLTKPSDLPKLPELLRSRSMEFRRELSQRLLQRSLESAVKATRQIMDGIEIPICAIDSQKKVVFHNEAWSHAANQGYEGIEFPAIGARIDESPVTNPIAFRRTPSGEPLTRDDQNFQLSNAIRQVLDGESGRERFESQIRHGRQLIRVKTSVFELAKDREPRAAVTHQFLAATPDHNQVFLESVPEVDHLTSLTPREQEVFHLVVTGQPNKSIANQLSISVKTVEMHRANMMRKLRVNSVPDLVRLSLYHSSRVIQHRS